MIDENLLELLCCPLDKQALRLAQAAEIELLNKKIQSGSLVNRAGTKITQSLEAALVTVDGQRFYPIWSEIPVLLVEESITPEV